MPCELNDWPDDWHVAIVIMLCEAFCSMRFKYPRYAGTERCHEAVTKMPGEYDIVINIQGDEPLIDPHVIDDTVRALQNSPESVYRWACCALL